MRIEQYFHNVVKIEVRETVPLVGVEGFTRKFTFTTKDGGTLEVFAFADTREELDTTGLVGQIG